MSSVTIQGNHTLSGEVYIQGSKNAALPMIAATILNHGKTVLKNCPNILDVQNMVHVLEGMGCLVNWDNTNLEIDARNVTKHEISQEEAKKTRGSFLFLGALLGRNQIAKIAYPGGCTIGKRKVDIHLKALEEMGVIFYEDDNLYADATNIHGNILTLSFPSVGATENIMLAAVFAEGETIIRHAAREPEIVDLQKFLVGMGADVTGAGTSTIRIRGSIGRLKDVEHTVIPDRIVAGTYLTAAGITGGDLTLKNVSAEHIIPVISYLRECGCRINTKKTTMHISGPTRPRSIDIIRTLPYPGFPTDMQSQFISLLSIARGTSIFVETIFENRYKHVEELMRMGANIRLEGSLAVIKGVRELTGATVTARDLRGGAALVLAGLVAEGTTVISGIKHIDRGYENIEDKLSKVGALIIREE